MNKPNIVEFNLLDFNRDMDVAWQSLQDIYHTCLVEDQYWHFFYEGNYSIIRCSKKYRRKVEKYLNNNNIEYEYVDKWKDGSKHVEKYKIEFISLFHCFSMLALQIPESEFQLVADRITHCFFNHCTYSMKDARKKYGNMWEPIIMGLLTNYRASYIGRCEGINEMADYYTEIGKNVGITEDKDKFILKVDKKEKIKSMSVNEE